MNSTTLELILDMAFNQPTAATTAYQSLRRLLHTLYGFPTPFRARRSNRSIVDSIPLFTTTDSTLIPSSRQTSPMVPARVMEDEFPAIDQPSPAFTDPDQQRMPIVAPIAREFAVTQRPSNSLSFSNAIVAAGQERLSTDTGAFSSGISFGQGHDALRQGMPAIPNKVLSSRTQMPTGTQRLTLPSTSAATGNAGFRPQSISANQSTNSRQTIMNPSPDIGGPRNFDRGRVRHDISADSRLAPGDGVMNASSVEEIALASRSPMVSQFTLVTTARGLPDGRSAPESSIRFVGVAKGNDSSISPQADLDPRRLLEMEWPDNSNSLPVRTDSLPPEVHLTAPPFAPDGFSTVPVSLVNHLNPDPRQSHPSMGHPDPMVPFAIPQRALGMPSASGETPDRSEGELSPPKGPVRDTEGRSIPPSSFVGTTVPSTSTRADGIPFSTDDFVARFENLLRVQEERFRTSLKNLSYWLK